MQFHVTIVVRLETKNVLKARHIGFTPRAKGCTLVLNLMRKLAGIGPNLESRLGDLNLEILADKHNV